MQLVDRPHGWLRVLTQRTHLLPGLGVAAGAATASLLVSQWLPSVSPLLLAIAAGAVLANTAGVAPSLRAGLAVAAKRWLRVGVALLGFQLALTDIAGLGWRMVVVVVGIVSGGIVLTLGLGRLLKVAPGQRLLIACGFSICGAAAVAAVGGVADVDEEEVASSVALVVLFGTAMIPVIPLLSRLAGLSEHRAGLWAGGSIHEVAQVVAAGGLVSAGALAPAVVVKLARVLMLRSSRSWPSGDAVPTEAGAPGHTGHHWCRSSSWRSWPVPSCAPLDGSRAGRSAAPTSPRRRCSLLRCSPSAAASMWPRCVGSVVARWPWRSCPPSSWPPLPSPERSSPADRPLSGGAALILPHGPNRGPGLTGGRRTQAEAGGRRQTQAEAGGRRRTQWRPVGRPPAAARHTDRARGRRTGSTWDVKRAGPL